MENVESKALSQTQKNVLDVLSKGGRLFLFEDGTTGLDDVDGNTLVFRGRTFDVLFHRRLIKVVERPALGVEIYGLV